MEKIALVLDTASNLDFEMAKQFGFELLPYSIEIEGELYDDLLEIPREGFYERLEKENMSTGIPSIGKIQAFMEGLVEKGYNKALVFTVSAEMSGMYSAMKLHAEVDGLEVYVLDSRTVGAGIALLALYAKELMEAGHPFRDLVKACALRKDGLEVIASFRTLKYLMRGGRVSSFKGLLGETFKIFPTITVVDGKLDMAGKARGKTKSQKQIVDKVRNDLKGVKNFDLAFFHAENDEEMNEVKEELSDLISRAQLVLDFPSTSVLGVHGGPKYIGVSYFKR